MAKKSNLFVRPKETQTLVKDEKGTPVVIFVKDKEYQATIVSDDSLVAVGEDGEVHLIGGNEKGTAYWKDWEFMRKFDMIDAPITVIETEIWEAVADKPGYVREVGKKTMKQVYEVVEQFLKERDIWDYLDYFNAQHDYSDKKYMEKPFPSWRWISCYAVVGNSEGYYIHVDAVTTNGERIPLYLGKTFVSMDYALYVSNMLTKVFWDTFNGCDVAPEH